MTTLQNGHYVIDVGQSFAASKWYQIKGQGGQSACRIAGALSDLGIGFRNATLTSAGYLPDSRRSSIIGTVPIAEPTLADLVPIEETDEFSFQYIQEVTLVNAAAETAEGALAPELTIDFEERDEKHRSIDVFLPVTQKLFEDSEAARRHINNRLPFLVRERLSRQLVQGDGLGENITGFHSTTGINTVALGPTPTAEDKLSAILQAEHDSRVNGEAAPDALVIHPTDWLTLEQAKDAAGNDLRPRQRFEHLRIVQTTHQTVGRALVGAFTTQAVVSNRRGIDIQTSRQHLDWFQRGILAMRATMPVWLAVLRPAAFTEVTGLNL